MLVHVSIGTVVNQLTVLNIFIGPDKRSWSIVKCTCGVEKDIRTDHLRRSLVKSCGCYRKVSPTTFQETHGMSLTTEYEIWASMKKRFNNPAHAAYPRYGGRGVTVCPEWEKFENFYADMGPRPTGMSIERKDNDEGYSKGNCIWATDTEQSNNRRNVKKFHIGDTHGSIAEVCRALGMPRATVWARLKAGWEPQKAFTEPVNRKKGLHLVKNT